MSGRSQEDVILNVETHCRDKHGDELPEILIDQVLEDEAGRPVDTQSVHRFHDPERCIAWDHLAVIRLTFSLRSAVGLLVQEIHPKPELDIL
jgi:hypothetical protein